MYIIILIDLYTNIQSKDSLAKGIKSRDHTIKDALDFFGDGPTVNPTNEDELAAKTRQGRAMAEGRRKRKRGDKDSSSGDDEISGSDSEDGEEIESESGESSEGEEQEQEGEEEGDGGETDLQLFAGHTPLEWKKKGGGGALTERRTERKKRKKKKLDKESKEILRRQEVREGALEQQYACCVCTCT